MQLGQTRGGGGIKVVGIKSREMAVELNIYTVHILNKSNQVGCTNIYAKIKQPSAFQTAVIFSGCY
jgi:hypothetical protein